MKRAALLLLLAACGGASSPPPVDVPSQPPSAAAEAGAPLPVAPDGGAERRTLEDVARPGGANGPRSAIVILGPIGQIVDGPPPTMLVVNTAEMRAHPSGATFGKALTTALVGWNSFLPVDLIDPVKDTDWVVMSGNIHLGATGNNTILARYNVTETRADTIWKELEKRLPAKPLATNVTGAKTLTARVDGAERAYVRGKPGTLAIVPASSAKPAALVATTKDAPTSIRPGELFRFVARDQRALRLGSLLTDDAGPIVLWLETSGAGAIAHAEVDCGTHEKAEQAVASLRARLQSYARNPFLVRFTDPLVKHAEIRADDATLRYRAEIDATLLQFLDGAL